MDEGDRTMNDHERRLWNLTPWAAGGMTVAQAQKLLESMPGNLLDPVDEWGNVVPTAKDMAASTPIPGGRLPADQQAWIEEEMRRAATAAFDKAHYPPTGGDIDTIYVHDAEPAGNAPKPGQKGINKFGFQPSEADVALLARALYAEAGNSPEAWPGVAWSIFNRIDPNNPNRATLNKVLEEKNQFEKYGEGRWRHDPADMAPADKAAYLEAQRMARDMVAGQIPDVTRGGTYFYSNEVGHPPVSPILDGDRKPLRDPITGSIRYRDPAKTFFGSRLLSGRVIPTSQIGRFAFVKDVE
jgi:spore germination cell wall hydrolase CwlJ-like protein